MEEKKRHIAIVLAAGRGSRMGSAVPKQYMLLLDKPVLYYSLKCMEDSFIDDIILVCKAGDEQYCTELAKQYGFSKIRAVIAGGKERYDSVFGGLSQLRRLGSEAENGYVYIHDGARPCIDKELLAECRENVERYNACVPAVPVKDTIKVADGEGFCSTTPDRTFLMAAQTPQCFCYFAAWTAYDRMMKAMKQKTVPVNITDDAMVVQEYAGIKIKLCAGSYDNIKITTPEDIRKAENILKQREETR